MVQRCNRDLITTLESNLIESDFCPDDKCLCEQPNQSNADIKDINTLMDDRSFYEVFDFSKCEDLSTNYNEETLWVAICGEIKTPYGVLSNSIGQMNYGCRIWDLRGQNVDSLLVQEFEEYIIQTCLKYPEVNNVISIETLIGDRGNFLVTLQIDSIYGVFKATQKIPFARASNRDWIPSDEMFARVKN